MNATLTALGAAGALSVLLQPLFPVIGAARADVLIDGYIDSIVMMPGTAAADTDGDDDGNDPDEDYVCVDKENLEDCLPVGDMIARCVVIPDPDACCALDEELCSNDRAPTLPDFTSVPGRDVRNPSLGLYVPPVLPPPRDVTPFDSTHP